MFLVLCTGRTKKNRTWSVNFTCVGGPAYLITGESEFTLNRLPEGHNSTLLSVRVKSVIKIFSLIGYRQLHIIQSTSVAEIFISTLADIQILTWIFLKLTVENRTGWGRPMGDPDCERSLAWQVPLSPYCEMVSAACRLVSQTYLKSHKHL